MESEIKDSRRDAERQRPQSEKIADIRKEAEARFRELLEKHVDSLGHIQAMQQFNQAFDRIEAAHKREVEKLNSVIQATVSRSDAEIDRLRREAEELGNAAKIENALNEVCRIAFEIEASGNSPADEFRNHQRAININSIANQAKNELALLSNRVKNDNSGAAIITTGNYAKLREALKLCGSQMCKFCKELELARSMLNKRTLGVFCHSDKCKAFQAVHAALAAPPRQCDVGTAEEQTRRFRRYCDTTKCEYCESLRYKRGACSFEWGQMPYNESEVSHGNA